MISHCSHVRTQTGSAAGTRCVVLRDGMSFHAACAEARSVEQRVKQRLHVGICGSVVTETKSSHTCHRVSTNTGFSSHTRLQHRGDRGPGRTAAYLMKVTWSSYIHGCSSRLGYFPKGGTMTLKIRAMHTNTAGRTICTSSTLHEHIVLHTYKIFAGGCKPEQRSPSWIDAHTGAAST